MLLKELLGSKTRAAIVERLFSEEGRKVHVRELARMSGLSAPSLMREAKALVRAGVLVEENAARKLCTMLLHDAGYMPEKSLALYRKRVGGTDGGAGESW